MTEKKLYCILCFGEGPIHHGPCMMLNRSDYNRAKSDEAFFDKLYKKFNKENEDVHPRL